MKLGLASTSGSSWSKADCEKYMASIGTPWVMGYHPTTGKADSWNVTRPTNAEDAEVYGVETGLNWEFYPAWNFGINYTWTETEITDSKLGNPPLNDTPEHMVNASLKWQADDNIQLCHYSDAVWHSNVTLYKVALKCLVWLNAYDGHLRTGEPLDYFLKHQPL